MEHEFVAILTALKIATVILGVVFLTFTLRAYLKHRSRSLLVFFVAILLITIGTVAEGLAFQGLQLSLDQAHVIEGVFTLAGYVVLVSSLMLQRFHRAKARLTETPDLDEGGESGEAGVTRTNPRG